MNPESLEFLLASLLGVVLFVGIQVFLFRRRMRQRALAALEAEAMRQLQARLRREYGSASADNGAE